MKPIFSFGLLSLLGLALAGCHAAGFGGSSAVNVQAAQSLTQEIAASKSAGTPTTGAELQAPLPPPEENAAPVYAELMQLLQTKPLARTDENAVTKLLGLFSRTPPTAEEIAAGRRVLTERKDVLDLIHKAASRPKCVFTRDWGKGFAVLFPEYARMRSAARWLSAESALQLLDGKPQEAIRTQALGFQIAQHAASDPILIADLVAVAIDSITLRGMERILYKAGGDAQVDTAVQQAIAQHWKPHSLAHAMRGEAAMQIATVEILRKEAPEKGWNELFAGQSAPVMQNPPRDQESWHRFLDGNAATMLHAMNRVISVADRPYSEAQPVLASVSAEFEQQKNDPNHVLGALLFPALELAAANLTRDRALAEVVRSSAAILAWKAQHNSLPETLADVLSPVPTDPFNGQPLSYRNVRFRFVVYSVGPTGQFDASVPDVTRDNKEAVFRYPPPVYSR